MIIFDFDGVLVESIDAKTRAFANLFENEGREIVRQVVDYHLENGGLSRYEKFRYAYEHILRRPLPEKRLRELGRQFSELSMSDVVMAPWVRGAREFLEEFHDAVDLCVATGTPHEEILQIVAQRKMEHFFRDVIGTPPGKEEIIRGLVQSACCDRDEIAMVGDSPQDLAGAVAAGIRFIGRVHPSSTSLSREETITKIPDLLPLRTILGL